jgi:single-stranded DNA-specific DHH superfamily exonuclease
VFGFAESDGKIKISARASRDLKQINLKEIIVYAIEQLHADGGGHKFAAGGLIQKIDKDKFVEIVDRKIGETLGSKGKKS